MDLNLKSVTRKEDRGLLSMFTKSSSLRIYERGQSDLPAPPPERQEVGSSSPIRVADPVYQDLPEESWPFEQPLDRLVEEAIIREADKLTQGDKLLNKIVYDNTIFTSPFPDSLVFESRFESGNLKKAVQINPFEYDLWLSPDINTRTNTQWFYFTISNTQTETKYKFNIKNMIKPTSLYNYGMKPCLYSQKEAQVFKRGWFRGGTDICYYQNTIKKKSGSYFYTLSFSLQFNFQNDTVSVAHCYPYTFSDLNRDIDKLVSDPKRRNRLRRSALCFTLGGKICEVLTVTSFLSDPGDIRQRKGVMVMARVHPGETNASWMMKGLLEYLTGPSLDAKILRDNFIFKIIPMLNPDGVINGAYRCGLAGVDLNRCWIDPQKRLHPTIFYAKNLIREFVQEREVVLSCDFHGHSRKKNLFIYGCGAKNSIREKVFPKLMERCSEHFSFSDCVFGLQKAKEATARVTMYREFGICNSYTLESSFCGSSSSGLHFTCRDLMNAGKALCEAVLDLCDPDQRKVNAVVEELERFAPKIQDEDALAVDIRKRASSKKRGTFKKRKKQC